MLIHTKDLNFIQPVLEEYCLKIQAVATNSCTFLQQPFIEPPPPRVGSSKGQAFTTVTVQPTGWPSGPDSLVSTHAPKRLRRSLPFPTPLSSQSPSIIHLPQLLHPQSWVVFVYPPAAAATSHALARLTLLSVSASKRSSTHLANKADSPGRPSQHTTVSLQLSPPLAVFVDQRSTTAKSLHDASRVILGDGHSDHQRRRSTILNLDVEPTFQDQGAGGEPPQLQLALISIRLFQHDFLRLRLALNPPNATDDAASPRSTL
ncbi:hypothetical protein FOMG_06763 [Fusarium oxysporum f. sp. melonis 26406]|uniref:Uncharacterized protein n=1 Tax=Fusarium oxysporum f. sp. melonis 26406 TaxID=1089452 RepID=X0A5Q5_FUSOX|nr:hypothetical protein FOMG_06763 [Fusarium oxysporum f. sp. melonis 26406]